MMGPHRLPIQIEADGPHVVVRVGAKPTYPDHISVVNLLGAMSAQYPPNTGICSWWSGVCTFLPFIKGWKTKVRVFLLSLSVVRY